MKKIKFYNGYEMPQLGLGTFLMSEEEAFVVVKEALDIGYRHFDTAQMYNNEKAIGEALIKSGYKRSDYFLTTKLQYHHNVNETVKRIEKSLEDLNTDYIDLFLIHWPNSDDKINLRTWRVLEDYYKRGIFKAIGVSNFTRYQLEMLLKEAEIKPMVNQIETHPGLSQVPVKKYLDKKQIKMISYGPLMRGHLNDEPYLSTLNSIATKHEATKEQIAISWGLNRGIMMIPKTSNLKRLKENFNSKNIVLTEEEMELIFSLNRGKRLYTDPANSIYGRLEE